MVNQNELQVRPEIMLNCGSWMGGALTKLEATAEVFWTAFKGLPRKEQQAVLQRVLRDKELRQDLLDLAVIDSRRTEAARPLRDYVKDSRRRG